MRAVRYEIQYDDGTVERFEGDEAEEMVQEINRMIDHHYGIASGLIDAPACGWRPGPIWRRPKRVANERIESEKT